MLHFPARAYLPVALTLALWPLGAGAGAVPAAASVQAAAVATGPRIAAATTLGTIHATIDGDARTWYVVAGQASDGPWASGAWLERQGGGHLITFGGLDDEVLPIETFSRGGGNPGQMSMGDYHGSSLTMAVTVDLTSLPLQVALPDDEAQATVIYLPVVDMSDMSGMLAMRSGQVAVEEADMADGKVRIRGTFSGTFEPMQGGDGVEISDGSFDIEGLPNVKEIQPTGG